MARFWPEQVLLVHVEWRALGTSVLLVAVLVQEHRDAVAREVFGPEGELDGRVRGEEYGPGAYGALGLLSLVAVFGSEDAGAEDEYLDPLGEGFERRVSVVGVEVVEEALQIGVAARVVEDGDGRGVFGLGGDDVSDVEVLGRFGLRCPEEELVGRGRALLAGNDPAYRAGDQVQKTIVQHLVPPVRCELALQPRVGPLRALHQRLQDLLDVLDRVDHRRPPRVGLGQGRPLGEDPTRYLVDLIRLGLAWRFDAHERAEGVSAALRRPHPEVPGGALLARVCA